jgi:hypothetical protein
MAPLCISVRHAYRLSLNHCRRTRRYGGSQTRFTIGMAAAGHPDRLPTASTCFNKLLLGGEYPSAAVLEAKLRTAVFESRGFAEVAVAV